MRRKIPRVLGAIAVATFGLAAYAGISAATSSPTTFHACLHNGSLSNVSGSSHTCKSGYKAVSWNAVGPTGSKGAPGAPGVSIGVTATSVTPVALSSAMAPVTVLTAGPATVAGNYFASASITAIVAANDYVACYLQPEVHAEVPIVGPVGSEMYQTLPLEGVVPLTAGESISVKCAGYNGSASTEFYGGTVDAVLVNSAIGAPSGGVLKQSSARGARGNASHMIVLPPRPS